jgi:hypothetical protein
LLSAAAEERVAALVPPAELKVYGGAPHALMYTERDQLNADPVSFIREG